MGLLSNHVRTNSQTINNNSKQSRVSRHFPADVVEVTDEMLANHFTRIAPLFLARAGGILSHPGTPKSIRATAGPSRGYSFLTIFSPHRHSTPAHSCSLASCVSSFSNPVLRPPFTCARPHCLIIRPAHFDGRLPLTRRPKARTRHPGKHRHHPSCRLHHLIERP